MTISPNERERASRTVTALLVALLVIAAAVRFGAAAPRAAAVFDLGDAQVYRELGGNLASGHGLTMTDFAGRVRVADRMPGYPALLAALDGLFGSRATWALLVLQALAGAATVLLAYLAAREICPGVAAGLVAAALVALEPWQVYFSTVALTECWSALLLTATIYFAARAIRTSADIRTAGQAGRGTGENSRWWWAVAAGAACAALVYFHPEFLGLPAAFAVAALVAPGRRKWLPLWAVGTAVVVAALGPWWVRNYELLGRPVAATTRLGTTLWDGVRPGATGESDMRFEQVDDAQTRGLNEIEYDAHYRRLALGTIAEEPGRIARLALTKAGRLWSPTPNAAMGQAWYYRWAGAAGWAVMMAGAALGGAALRRRSNGAAGALVLLLVPAVWVTLVHLVLVGSVRYRAPVEPLLCILAGCGYATAGLIRQGRSRRTGERE
jgi:hypothetical protein